MLTVQNAILMQLTAVHAKLTLHRSFTIIMVPLTLAITAQPTVLPVMVPTALRVPLVILLMHQEI